MGRPPLLILGVLFGASVGAMLAPPSPGIRGLFAIGGAIIGLYTGVVADTIRQRRPPTGRHWSEPQPRPNPVLRWLAVAAVVIAVALYLLLPRIP